MKVILAILSLVVIGVAAQADVIRLRSGVKEGKIVRVQGGQVFISVQMAAGSAEVPIPLAEIVSVEAPKPAGLYEALTAVKERKYAEGAAALTPFVTQFAGLPVDWAQQSIEALGDAQLGLKQFDAAAKTFDQMKKLYPKVTGLEVKVARIQVAQKQCAAAMPVLNKLIEPLRAKAVLTENEENSLAEALILRGDCLKAANAQEDALDSYLAVVAIFNGDSDRVAEAKFRAGQLFEELKNFRRARTCYEELSKESSVAVIAEDAKKRLAALPPEKAE